MPTPPVARTQTQSWKLPSLLASILSTALLSANPPVLTDFCHEEATVRFTLVGQTNATYVIESARNLTNWIPVLTNNQAFAVRQIEFESPSNLAMFRCFRQATPMFKFALASSTQINANGNNLALDSFDSTEPFASTHGHYDPTKAKDIAQVTTTMGLVNSLSIGTTTIKGTLHTGPGAQVNLGASGAIGSAAWFAGGNIGAQIGHVLEDANACYLPVSPPFKGGAFTPSGGSVNGTNYDYILAAGNYEMANLSMSGRSAMIVVGDAILYVTGNISITGLASILILPGASLKLYGGGTSTILGGDGIVNSGLAANFGYFGLPNNTHLLVSSSIVGWRGTVYTPNADVTLSAGGSPETEISGAVVAKSITLNSHLHFHYDESLNAP